MSKKANEIVEPRTDWIDNKIIELQKLRSSILKACKPEILACYEIKDYINKRKYSIDIDTILREYKHILNGDRSSCSVEDIVGSCRASVDALFKLGYRG